MARKDFYLIVKGTRRYHSSPICLSQPRIASAKRGKTPSVKAGEVAIKVTLDLPNALFTEPQYAATIKVNKEDVSAPSVNAEVIDNIQQVVAEATGLTLTIESLEVDDEQE